MTKAIRPIDLEFDEAGASLESLNRAAAHVTFLSEAGRVLSSSIVLQDTFRNLAEVVVPAMADACAITFLKREGTMERVILSHADKTKERRLLELDARYPLLPESMSGMPLAIRTGTTEVITSIPPDRLLAETGLRVLVEEIGLRSYITTPMVLEDGKVIGAIWLGISEGRRSFSEDDLPLAKDLALLAAQAVRNARLHEKAVNEAERRAVLFKIREDYVRKQTHDLKTPLTAALLLTGLIERASQDSPKITELSRKATENIHRVTAMINNMKSESGARDVQ